jgi:hypothetical protein
VIQIDSHPLRVQTSYSYEDGLSSSEQFLPDVYHAWHGEYYDQWERL